MLAFCRYKILLFFIIGITTSMFGQETFLDNFTFSNYGNNNGSLNFANDWNDSEDNNPGNGRIRIANNGFLNSQLRFRNLDNERIDRDLDLSGASSVILTLDYQRTNGNERIAVQLFNGNNYNTVAVLSGNGSISYTLNTNEISANSSIRFRSDSGNWSSSETIFIDNVLFVNYFRKYK